MRERERVREHYKKLIAKFSVFYGFMGQAR